MKKVYDVYQQKLKDIFGNNKWNMMAVLFMNLNASALQALVNEAIEKDKMIDFLYELNEPDVRDIMAIDQANAITIGDILELLLSIHDEQRQSNATKAVKGTILIEYFKVLKSVDAIGNSNHQNIFITGIVKQMNKDYIKDKINTQVINEFDVEKQRKWAGHVEWNIDKRFDKLYNSLIEKIDV